MNARRIASVVELASDVSPACSLADLATFVKMMEARISIRLQGAVERAQVLARMLALAIRRIRKPHCRRRIKTGRAIIAYIGP
jgi:hypothetical protein